MNAEDIKRIIAASARRAAEETVQRLKNAGMLRSGKPTTYKKVEDLLYLCPKLPPEHPERLRVEAAIDRLAGDNYVCVIRSIYFDRQTVESLAEDLGISTRNAYKQRTRIVKMLASQLFPEDVCKEILER